jgi:hypothetical protein
MKECDNQSEGKRAAVQFKTMPCRLPQKTAGQNSFGRETKQAPHKHKSNHLLTKTIFSVYQCYEHSY